MSHHASGPNFEFPRGDARLDMTDLFVFPKPGSFQVNNCPRCASVFQAGLAKADDYRALCAWSIIRNQD